MGQMLENSYGQNAKLKDHEKGFSSLIGTKNNEVILYLVACVCCAAW